MDQDSGSKLSATQNVIRDKFEKAYTNRLEHEHDVNQVFKPLATPPSTPSSMNHAIKTGSVGTKEEMQYDPNELCERLRLLASSQIAGDVNHAQETNSIIVKLRELKIIV